jgi:hypothetical protein
MTGRVKAAVKFVNDLAAVDSGPNWVWSGPVFNPWRDRCPALDLGDDPAAARRARLLSHLQGAGIEVVLVGEAPGYQGCRYSGVAFTSERLLLEGRIPSVEVPVDRLTRRNKPFSEPSATIVWNTIRDLGLEGRVALWNAFPFHPYAAGDPMSNRTPTADELDFGGRFLSRLLNEVLPAGVRLLAVGGHAAGTLRGLGFEVPDAHALRHPANGGATKFRNGMAAVFAQ